MPVLGKAAKGQREDSPELAHGPLVPLKLLERTHPKMRGCEQTLPQINTSPSLSSSQLDLRGPWEFPDQSISTLGHFWIAPMLQDLHTLRVRSGHA